MDSFVNYKAPVSGKISKILSKKELIGVKQVVDVNLNKVAEVLFYETRKGSTVYCIVRFFTESKFYSFIGDATGYGYHKLSAAFADALCKGDVSVHDVSGRGDDAINETLKSLADEINTFDKKIFCVM